jgi:hypothetical protein
VCPSFISPGHVPARPLAKQTRKECRYCGPTPIVPPAHGRARGIASPPRRSGSDPGKGEPRQALRARGRAAYPTANVAMAKATRSPPRARLRSSGTTPQRRSRATRHRRYSQSGRRVRSPHIAPRSWISMRDCRTRARKRRRSSTASRVYRPCFSAFLLPRGAPDPGAPPCIRQRFFPLTAGDLHAAAPIVECWRKLIQRCVNQLTDRSTPLISRLANSRNS